MDTRSLDYGLYNVILLLLGGGGTQGGSAGGLKVQVLQRKGLGPKP